MFTVLLWALLLGPLVALLVGLSVVCLTSQVGLPDMLPLAWRLNVYLKASIYCGAALLWTGLTLLYRQVSDRILYFLSSSATSTHNAV